MKTILTMPSPELALLTMTGEGKPFVLNRRTMAELEALLDEVRRRAPRALVLTGEGWLDAQSLRGKAVIGVARRAKKQGVPCAALVGGLTGPLDAAYAQGLTAAFPICPGPVPLEKALTGAEENLLASARNALRLFLAGNK